ncbi:unnamed protein product [Adineta ricciae]|uniref:Uncharacterized protein n=1 Tax=Adineta ricciae TaxID=249248 RepID=A0A814DTT8_ADIRI|nr:unnamed protein product [Adineta ricciae]CAF0958485.1 unnamed protein product [Adineta ricciae]
MQCPTPEIVAGQLTAIRNIYLRQELKTICNLIQTKHRERLPALDLVTLAAYEQVFNAQPLSSPEVLRERAVKYILIYYTHNLEKLSEAEESYGLRSVPPVVNAPLINDTTDNEDNFSTATPIPKSLSESPSNQYVTLRKTDQRLLSKEKSLDGESPQIVVHRPSDHSGLSKKTKTSSDSSNNKRKRSQRKKRRSKTKR